MSAQQLNTLAHVAASFIERHYPQAREWDDLVGWCTWYISHGFMCALPTKNGTIGALCAARTVNGPEDGQIAYKHAQDGQCVFIDLLIITDKSPSVYGALGDIMRERFGKRMEVAFQRLAIHDYEDFLRNIMRVKRIGTSHYVTTKTT